MQVGRLSAHSPRTLDHPLLDPSGTYSAQHHHGLFNICGRLTEHSQSQSAKDPGSNGLETYQAPSESTFSIGRAGQSFSRRGETFKYLCRAA
jgi:hypothetical protein